MGINPPPELTEAPTLPAKYREALERIRDPVRLASQRWQEQRFSAHRDGAHPDIIEFEAAFIRRLQQLGVPMFASEVWRLPERQDELFAKGVSKAKGGQSPHNYGCAADLVHAVHGWNLTDREWEVIGHVGKELAKQRGLKLVWGGDWKFYDPAHWEVANWREIRQLLEADKALTVPKAVEQLKAAKKQRSQW